MEQPILEVMTRSQFTELLETMTDGIGYFLLVFTLLYALVSIIVQYRQSKEPTLKESLDDYFESRGIIFDKNNTPKTEEKS